MKNLLLFLVLFTSAFPQQFSRLNGLEDSQGNTILLYSFGVDPSGRFSPTFKYDVNSGIDAKIMDAYSNVIDTSYTNSKTIGDYEFFPNDVNNFINVGFIFDTVTVGYAARNDTILFNTPIIFSVDISKQNPLKVFLFGNGGPIRSWDGGYSYPLDSIPGVTNFIPIALSDFDDNVMFGFNEDNKFSRNTIVVDTSLVVKNQYFKMLYDINQFHIYRINWTYGGYSLNVSNNKGDANSWTKTYQSENPIYATIDSTQSGLVYLADGRSIYKSVNNGYTFTHYKSLPSKLVGIYKKPDSEILYVATKYKIYEITPGTVQVIKQIKPVDYYSWYPLKIGNLWIYENYYFENGTSPQFVGYSWNWINSTKILQNGKEYFEIIQRLTNSMIDTQYVRLDSLDAILYGYSTTSAEDLLYESLYSEVGDSICYEYNPVWACQIVQSEEQFNIWGINSIKRDLRPNYSGWICGHSLVKGIGLYSNGCGDLIGFSSILKGCIIDGIVYGDTTISDVEKNTDLIPIEFKLEQNYPNPFNPGTIIIYQLPKAGKVTIKVLDVLGEELITLVDEYKDSGKYEVQFNALNLPSGVYFYQLRAGDYVEAKKMILLK
jgi:hypothetical protein